MKSHITVWPVLCLLFTVPLALIWSQEKDSISDKQIVFPIKRVPPPNRLPSEIRAWLNQQYRGWKWVDNYMIFEYKHPDVLKDYPFNPNYISADFSGDKRKDYVVQISQPEPSDSMHLIIAFVSKEKGFDHHILSTNDGRLDIYLWLSKKGTKYYSYDTDEELIFPRDAVTVVVWERGSASYVFRNRKFVAVTTGD